MYSAANPSSKSSLTLYRYALFLSLLGSLEESESLSNLGFWLTRILPYLIELRIRTRVVNPFQFVYAKNRACALVHQKGPFTSSNHRKKDFLSSSFLSHQYYFLATMVLANPDAPEKESSSMVRYLYETKALEP